LYKKYLNKEQAIEKLKQYCAYQERCHHEVEQKLWDLGVDKQLHDEIISSLIESDHLNEERFAIHFAGGKFRMKQWGKKKITQALKEKKVSEYCIKKALKQIPSADYSSTLYKLAEKKHMSLKGEQYLVRKKKTIDYLLQKGFEYDLVAEALRDIE
jgi:regulatory protein